MVAAIYEEGIRTRNATFETAVPAWPEWDAAHLDAPRLVAGDRGDVVGWAALTPYSSRSCYRGVAGESVYVAERARGRGVGRALLGELVRRVGAHERIGQLDGQWRDVVLLERRSP